MITAAEMLSNISSNLPNLIALSTATMYLLGTYIVVLNVAEMRNAPAIHAPGQGQQSIWSLLKRVFVGAALIYFPTTIDVGTATLFSSTAPYSYIVDQNSEFKVVYDVAIKIILLVGVIAAGKGIYELAFGQGGNSQEKGHISGFTKGIMHFIGGILCINLETFVKVVLVTLGINELNN